MRAWFEFSWLRVETGGQRLGLMKLQCLNTWWNLIGVSDLGGGGMVEVLADVCLM